VTKQMTLVTLTCSCHIQLRCPKVKMSTLRLLTYCYCRGWVRSGELSGTRRLPSACLPVPALLCSPAGLSTRFTRRRWRSPSNSFRSLRNPHWPRYSRPLTNAWTVLDLACLWWLKTVFHQHVMWTRLLRWTTTLVVERHRWNCPRLSLLHRARPHTVNSYPSSDC